MQIFIPLLLACLWGGTTQANELLPLPGDSVLHNYYPEVEELTKEEEWEQFGGNIDHLSYGTINYSKEMPIFIGTGLVGEDYNTQKIHGDKQLLEYIHNNMKSCPDFLNQDCSLLVVSFKVTERGYVEDILLRRGNKEGCLGQQAIRLVEKMNEDIKKPWQPARYGYANKVVAARYNLPIRIRWNN